MTVRCSLGALAVLAGAAASLGCELVAGLGDFVDAQGGAGVQASGGAGGAGGETISPLVWSHAYGDVGDDRIHAMAMTAQGEIVIGGEFRGTLDLGGRLSSENGGGDAFVAKLRSDGSVVWQLAFGDNSSDAVLDLALTDDDAVLVAGRYIGMTSVGSKPLPATGNAAAFVAKIDPAGNALWADGWDSIGADSTTAVAVRGTTIVAAGLYGADLNIGAFDLTHVAGADMFVAWLGAGGEIVQAYGFGGSGEVQELHASIDGGGEALLAGSFQGALGLSSAATAAVVDGFVSKIASDGTNPMFVQLGGDDNQLVHDIAFDAQGFVIAGEFRGTLVVGNDRLVAADASDLFVAAYAADGTDRWSHAFGSGGDDAAVAVTTAASGEVVFAGSCSGSVDLGDGDVACAGGGDMLVAELSGAGEPRWSQVLGGPDSQRATAVALSPADGAVALAGVFSRSADLTPLGGQSYPSAGGEDMLLVKLMP